MLVINIQIDSPMVPSEWKKKGVLTHFSLVRKLEGGIFPMGLTKEVSDRNLRAGANTLALESRYAIINLSPFALHFCSCLVSALLASFLHSVVNGHY